MRRLLSFLNVLMQKRMLMSEMSVSSSMCGGARGVVVIVVGNGHGDTSSNLGPD